MDTDGQHDPEEIPKLVAPILAGEADMVNGSRYVNGNGKNTPFYRRIGQNVLDKATNLNSGLHITDTQSGFRAFAARVAPVFKFRSNGLAIESEMLMDAANAGLRVKEVEIGVEYKKRDTEGKITIAAMPAFNEEKYIAKMIIGCQKYVDRVIVVDDGSTDATAEIAEALGAIVIKHPENRGYGVALQTIFKTAREMKADAMVVIDSDGQHNPGEIPQLLKPLNNGADVVIGSRFIQTTDIPAYRKTGMKILDTATNIAGSIKVSDSQSGYRAYSKKAINEININGTGMSGGSEILLQVKEHDLKLAEVPINCRYDLEDISTHNPVSHGFSVLMSILNYVGEKRPVLFLGLPGTILILIGVDRKSVV
jgi:glycosyltransferase involved in cell wall biosynthesis